jgi:hypothetical protein
MLYPESLEQFSKVKTILTEDLTFKIDDLFQLKEIQKLANSKETLKEILSKISSDLISLNETRTEGKLVFDDKLMVYSLINLPNKMTKNDVMTLFDIKEGDITRIYKQSLFWILASQNEEFNSKFEKTLKTTKVEEENSLKYNITSSKMLKNAITKMIQQHIYNKEVNELKASSGGSNKKEGLASGKASGSGSINSSSGEKMSWRKKSDVSNNEYEKYYIN